MSKASQQARELWPYLQPYVQRAVRVGGTTGSSGGSSGGTNSFLGLSDVDPLSWDDNDIPQWDATLGKLVPVALSGGGGAPSPHDLDSIHHDGTLADAQAPQFLKTDGSRNLTGNLSVDAAVTIDGVDISNPSSGLEIASTRLRVNQNFGFTWTGEHEFTVDPQINANLDFIGGDRVITASSDITFTPADDLILTSTKTWRSGDYLDGIPIAGFSNHINSLGNRQLTINSIKADELHVRLFVADMVRVDVGEEYWGKSMGIVYEDFTTPSSIDGTVTIKVEDSPAFSGALFSANDWVLIRIIDDSGGGLVVASIWGQVSSYTDLGEDAEGRGHQSWTFTLRQGPTNQEVKAGNVIIDFGASGQGFVHLSTLASAEGPWIAIGDWSGADPYTPGNRSVKTQIGRLTNVSDAALNPDGYGLYSDNAYLRGMLRTAETRLDDDGIVMLYPVNGALGPGDIARVSWWADIDAVDFGETPLAQIAAWRGTILGTDDTDLMFVGIKAATGVSDGARLTLQAFQDDSITSIMVDSGGTISVVADNTYFSGHIIPNFPAETSFDIGSASFPWRTLYVESIQAETISGTTLSGSEWEHPANMTIDANSGGDTLVSVANQGAGRADFAVDRNITLGGTVDGVDIAAHAADNNAHHNQAHVLATGTALGTDHTISGAAAGQVLRALSATTAAFDVLQHTDLGGILPDQHHDPVTVGNTGIALSTQQISLFLNATASGLDITNGLRLADSVAGSGLTIASKVLAVGAGDGIEVAADAVAVDLATTSGLTFVSGDLAIDDSVAGSGLTIASKVLAVGAGDGIEVAADAVAVDLATTSGLTFVSGDLAVGAGDGIEVLTSSIAVDLATNSGMTFSSGDLTLGTPGAVSASSTNNVTTTTHTHAVTSSSNVSAVVTETLLESTAAGGLTLASLAVTGSVVIDEDLTAAATGFRVIHHTHDYDHAHVVINPSVLWTLDEQFGLDIDDNLLVRGWIVGKHAIQIEGALMLCHYDGPEPFETNFKGNPTGHMGQPGLSTGGVIYRPGMFQKAVQIADATTNLVTNPSFETGITGWAHGQNGTGSGMSQSADRSYVGTYSLTLNGSSTGAASATSPAFDSLNGWYTLFQARVWRETSADVEVVLFDHTAGVVRSTAVATLTEEWEIIYGGWLNTTGATASCSVRIRLIGGGNTADIWIDAVQAERSATQTWITPYVDGSLGGYSATGVPDNSGHVWGGTAHASISGRILANLSYPAQGNLNAERGTVMAWVNMVDNIPSTLQYIFSHFNSGNRIYLFVNTAGNWGCGLGSTASLVDSGVAAVDNTWTLLTMTWDGLICRLYVNGGEGGLGGDPSGSAAYTGLTAIGTTMRVGTNTSGGETFNGYICELSTIDRALDGHEIRAIYESQAPIFAEASTWHFRAGRNRIFVDAEGLWGYGANGGTILGLYAGDEDNPSATKSWGGINLAEGDFLIGDSNRGAYMQWDDSVGEIVIGKTGANSGYLHLDADLISMYWNAVERVKVASDGVRIRDETGTDRVVINSAGVLALKDSAGTNRIQMNADGTLSIRNSADSAVFSFNAAAGAEFTLPLTLGTSGGIYQGTGTFSNPAAGTGIGLKIWNSSGVGRIAGYNGGVLQWGADTNGKLTAGADNVRLDVNGIRIKSDTTFVDLNSYTFGDSSFNSISGLKAAYTGSENVIGVIANSVASRASTVQVNAFSPSGQVSGISINAFVNSVVQTTLGVSSTNRLVSVSPRLSVDQSVTTLAAPTVILTQADLSEEFIEFSGTAATGNPIEAVGAKTLTTTHFIRVSINGTLRYIPVGTIA